MNIVAQGQEVMIISRNMLVLTRQQQAHSLTVMFTSTKVDCTFISVIYLSDNFGLFLTSISSPVGGYKFFFYRFKIQNSFFLYCHVHTYSSQGL